MWRGCTIYAAKTKALISCAVTGLLICAFAFTYAKNRFFHDAATMLLRSLLGARINDLKMHNNMAIPFFT